jgi:dTMP kinase
MYLAGEFGKRAESVNAYAASVLYSIDRFASFKTEWEEFYNNGGIVISDRYTISNMIHQVPKILDEKEKEKYLEWLVDLEWGKIGIPKPDIVFFLDIPFEFSQKLMKNRENKITGGKKKDIHEKDGNYLKNAYETAKELSVKYGWNVISCVNRDKLRAIEDINDEMIKITLENI